MGATGNGGRTRAPVAIITGASRGIGLGIAVASSTRAPRFVITARRPEALAAAVDVLGGAANALGVAGNAADEAHQDEVIAKARETFGGLHLLVNNTGIKPV